MIQVLSRLSLNFISRIFLFEMQCLTPQCLLSIVAALELEFC